MIMKKILGLAAFLIVSLSAGLYAENEDLWLEFLEEPLEDRGVEVREVQYVLSGNLTEKAFRNRLLIQVGDRFSPEEWKKSADFQEDLLRAGLSLYSLEIYTIPLKDGGDKVVVEAVEGFPYGFAFWPWDVTLLHRNLFGGGETGALTLGATVQSLSYEDWFWGNLPAGGALFALHGVTEDARGFLQEEVRGSVGLQRRWSAWLETRISFLGSSWSYPDSYWALPMESAASVQEKRSLAGLTDSLIWSWGAEVQAGTPQAWTNLPGLGGGLGLTLGTQVFSTGTQAYRWAASLRAKAEPLPWLLYTLGVEYQQWDRGVPDPALVQSKGFRIPGAPWRSQGLFIARNQVFLAFLPAVNLGFTSLKIQPMAFGDLLFNRFPPTGEDGLIPAYGGGVDFRFSSPVGLSFLFGYKGSLVEGRRHGFLFEFKTDLY